MKKPEITKDIARQAGVTEAEAADLMDGVVREILTRLRSGKRASLPGVGSFRTGADGKVPTVRGEAPWLKSARQPATWPCGRAGLKAGNVVELDGLGVFSPDAKNGLRFQAPVPLLIPMVGLAIDGGGAYLVKSKLSSAVDGAALAAGRLMGTPPGASVATQISYASTTAQQFLAANFPTNFFLARNSSAAETSASIRVRTTPIHVTRPMAARSRRIRHVRYRCPPRPPCPRFS
jgi:nucleoid DNA-binding protein